jgi:hypothetical protein
MMITRCNNQTNTIVADDVVVGREPDGEILRLGVCNNWRTCKVYYPCCGSAVTVGSKVLFVSAYIDNEITGENEWASYSSQDGERESPRNNVCCGIPLKVYLRKQR